MFLSSSTVAESSADEVPIKHGQCRGRLFNGSAVLEHSDIPRPQHFRRGGCGRALLHAPGFEDSDSTELAEVLSDEARALCCPPLEVGLASEARSTTRRWRSRKDDDEDENDTPGELPHKTVVVCALFFSNHRGERLCCVASKTGVAALADALPPSLRALVVLGPAESTLEPPLNARGIARLRDQPLSTIAGLARLAAGFVGNDSGVSHLAAAAGAPGVTIFGPTDPDRWRPLGRVKVVRALKLADLTPAEVTAALKEIIGM